MTVYTNNIAYRSDRNGDVFNKKNYKPGYSYTVGWLYLNLNRFEHRNILSRSKKKFFKFVDWYIATISKSQPLGNVPGPN